MRIGELENDLKIISKIILNQISTKILHRQKYQNQEANCSKPVIRLSKIINMGAIEPRSSG